MKVKVEKKGPCRKVLNIEVPPESVAEEFTRASQYFTANSSLPGFRKGKAPQAIVEKRFAKEIKAEVQDRLLAGSYRDALKQIQLNPVAVIDIQDISLEKDKPMTFKVVLDVPPEFKLPKYTGISLKSEKPEIKDEDVQKRLDALLDRLGTTEPVEGRPVQKGDLAQIDYAGLCDGQPVSGLDQQALLFAQGKDFWMLVEEGNFIPGFNLQLPGMKIGEQREIVIEFPADYSVKALASKKVVYKVSLTAMRRRIPAAIDAALLKEFQVDSEVSLRGKIREALTAETDAREKDRLQNEIVTFMLGKISIDLPESVVQEETRHTVASIVKENMMQGMPRDQVEGRKEEFLSIATKSAGDKVKLGYILSRIAEEEKLSVEEAEVGKAIQALAGRYRVAPDAMRKELEEKKEIDGIRHQLLMKKTLDFLLENAKINQEVGFFGRLRKT